MPKRVVSYVRQHLINSHCRTYYFEFRNGQRLMSPAVQEETRLSHTTPSASFGNLATTTASYFRKDNFSVC